MTTTGSTAGSLLWWDLAVIGVSGFAVYLLIGARITGDQAVQGGWFWTGVAAWGSVLIVYAAIGRTELRRSMLDLPRRPIDAILIGLVVLASGIAAAAHPALAVVQAVGYAIVWMLSRSYTQGVAGNIVLAVAVGAGMSVSLSRGDEAYPWLTAVIIQALSLGSALAVGSWITHVSREEDQQRRLVAELTQAQQQIAQLSEEAGASAERERLSAELHDTLTQTLAGLVMLAEQAGRVLDAGDGGRGRERIARVEAAARTAVSEARAIVASAHPLDDEGFEAAVTQAGDRLRGDTGIDVRCDFDAGARLSREHQVVLLRVVQEGLANVRAHARASLVRLRLRDRGDGLVELSIVDDGVGPAERGSRNAVSETGGPPRTAEGLLGGYGIMGLRERLRRAGGELDFGPSPGGGTRLAARIPSASGHASNEKMTP